MNTNHKIILKRGVSLTAAAMIGFSTIACGTGSTAKVDKDAKKETKADREKLETAVTSTSFGASDEDAEKVETVYVNSDAEGTVNDIVVSDWLRNYQGEDNLTDVSNLTDIENVKGEEKYVKNSDGTITWAANGNDIFYQGKTNSELPVSVKVSYKLDGKDIEPEDLAGKSGKVTIRFDYENTAKQKVTVNGREEEITVPFAMLSGMILPSDTFSNITVTNGRVISDANKNIVVGAALPGLKESLQLDQKKLDQLDVAEDISIPEYVEVTADTTNFELGMTMTMGSCDILSDLGFSDLDNSSATDKLNADMDLLTSSMGQLISGSEKLKNGSRDLKNGLDTLYSGTKTLKAGTDTLGDKVPELTAGANALKNGAKALEDGAAALKNGAGQLVAGYEGDGTAANPGAVAGISTLVNGIKSVPAQIKNAGEAKVVSEVKASLTANAAALSGLNELGTLFASMAQSTDTTAKAAGATCGADLQKVSADVAAITGGTATGATIKSLCNDIFKLDKDMAANKDTIKGAAVVAGIAQGIVQQSGGVVDMATASVQAARLVEGVQSGAITDPAQRTMVASANDTASAKIDGAIASLDKMLIGSTDSAASMKGLTSAVASLEAIDSVSGTLTDPNGVYQSQLVAGAVRLADGVAQLYAGTKQLSDGAGKLSTGGATFANGATAFANGAGALADGADKLSSGVNALNDGAKKLDDGADTLYNGMKTLNEGLVRFDQEGIQKLAEAFNGDIQSFANRLKAVDEAAKGYTNFGGADQEMSSSVKFIIETSAISADKD